MKHLFVLLCLLVIPYSAEASSWLACEVEAKVLEKDGEIYRVFIKNGVVIDGFSAVNAPCLEGKKGKEMKVPLKGSIPLNKMVKLKYEFYSAMGVDGPVSSEAWKILGVE